MMLLPGEPMMNGMPASKLCSSLSEIEEALEEAERVHVRCRCPCVDASAKTWSQPCSADLWPQVAPALMLCDRLEQVSKKAA